jgi:archaellum component FlaC
MLLNEFLKEHRKNEKQEETITQLKKELQATAAQQQQQQQIEMLTAVLQKVSAQLAAASPSSRTAGELELSKFATGRIRGGGPAPQVVNNP